MPDVFVSYKAEDRARVKPLVQALEQDGYSVWWDEQIGGGASWRRAIEAELEAAKCVIVVWSKRSVGSDGTFVQDEAARAQQRHVYVPVLIDKVRPPLGFGETQALPLNGWHGDGSDQRYAAIVNAVRCIVAGGQPTPLRRRSRAPSFSRRSMLVGGGLAVIGAGAFGGWLLLRPGPAAASDSIAVLPFDNLSGDPAQAYFSDGMAEELRSALTRIPDLRVVARTSSEAVRNEDVRTAAHRLGVSNILTGSVRRSATTMRISAQLVDGTTGLERWSEDFDQPIGDTLAIQSGIAQRVADALRIQLGAAAKAALTLGGTRNAEAQDHFLKATQGRLNDTAEGLQRSITELNTAIALDPNYVQAYASKSALLSIYGADWARSPSELALDLNEAVASAQRAIALAPNLAQGHSALGYAYKLQLRFNDALREMQTAVSLSRADAAAQGRYALLLVNIGRNDEALRASERAVALDPLNPGAYEQKAMVLFLSHHFPAAADAARQSLNLNPSGTFVRGILTNSLIMMARYHEALAEFTKMPPDSFQALTGRGIIAARMNDKRGVGDAVRQLRAAYGDSVNYELAEIYSQGGDADTAIDYLRKPESQRDPGFIFILGDPFLDPIRGDPRLTTIIKSLNLPS